MSQSLVALSVKLEARTRQDGKVWLAWCPALDVMTQAGSEQGALVSLREAVELWFESCLARNVLDKALTEAGFYRMHPGDAVPSSGSFVAVESKHTRTLPGSVGAAFTGKREIEVSIPVYVAAQRDSSSNPRASHRLEETRQTVRG
jgi:predicted RNase H-like HicB family nuclease